MNRIAIIATYEPRYDVLTDAINSLYRQVDAIIIADNDKGYIPEKWMQKVRILHPEEDMKDLAKLITAYTDMNISTGDFICTCDDDLIYPKEYVYTLMKECARHQCIGTFHGKTINRDTGAIEMNIGCLYDSNYTGLVDVPGTGVSGFFFSAGMLSNRTFGYLRSKYIGAADFALANIAADVKRPIMHFPHREGWIKYNPQMYDGRPTLWDMERINALALEYWERWIQ